MHPGNDFTKEYPEIRISGSEFFKRRPFWIVKLTVKDRDASFGRHMPITKLSRAAILKI